KKGRAGQNAFLLEGWTLLLEALSRGAEPQLVVFRGGEAASGGCIGSADDGRGGLEDLRMAVLREDLFDRLSDTVTPGAVLSVVTKPDFGPDALRGGSCVILDRLQDPGNVGTIIRTAEAAGMTGVIAVKGTADIWSQKVCRSAAGALLRLPVIAADGAREALELVRSLGMRPVRCDMNGTSLYETGALDGDVAFIIGNEGGGISKEFADAVPDAVCVPMAAGSESLNAAVAAAIVMYEKRRVDGSRLSAG
ncbi:MAG: RNA methyltransferase, partial [Clostridiales Family XIII bacterium]|nr:RNA methyltransferase [Clostridiales Family XIII bacterium]